MSLAGTRRLSIYATAGLLYRRLTTGLLKKSCLSSTSSLSCRRDCAMTGATEAGAYMIMPWRHDRSRSGWMTRLPPVKISSRKYCVHPAIRKMRWCLATECMAMISTTRPILKDSDMSWAISSLTQVIIHHSPLKTSRTGSLKERRST